ncbi:MAG: DUF1800 family protein, partial [Chloroflexota bacterium]
FDLHTLGLEHYYGVKSQDDIPTDVDGKPLGYVDEDVYEAARCFTGWTVNEEGAARISGSSSVGTFLYRESWHDRFQKFVLGNRLPADQDIMKDGNDALDILSEHPGTARHIATKLIQRLVTDTPSEALVTSTAALFLETSSSDDQLKQVVAHILRSDEFKGTWGGKIKRPFEYVTSALRALDTTLFIQQNDFDSDEFMWHYAAAGQLLFQWPSPDGYPDHYTKWLSTTNLVMAWRVIKYMIGKTAGNDGVTFYNDVISQTPTSAETPTQLANFWIDRLLHREPDETYAENILGFISLNWEPDQPIPFREESVNGNNYKDKLRTMVALILQSPEFVVK